MAVQIFISYRRVGGEWFAHLMYDRLRHDGYDVFLDVESLRSGKFNEALYKKIRECTDFLLILPPNGLDRCKNENDWVRLEIECAIKENKNIVPIMLRNFEFPKDLPESLKDLPNYNGIEASSDLFTEALVKLKEKRLESKPNPIVIEYGTSAEEAIPNYDEEEDFDKQIDEIFDKRFHSAITEEGEKESSSNLVKKIENIKNEKFYANIVNVGRKEARNCKLFCNEKEKGKAIEEELFEENISLMLVDETFEGMHFSLFEPQGTKTFIFKVALRKDCKTLEKYYTCERLDYIEELAPDNQGTVKTYFIDNPSTFGDQLVLYHFIKDRLEVKVNMGILENGVVKISRNPINMHWTYFDDNLEMNNLAFNLESLSKEERDSFLNRRHVEKWHTGEIRDNVAVIIDPETGELIKREIFYDEKTKKWKARFKLCSYKPYFAFNVECSNGKYRMPLTNLEIANCYRDGQFNFPKDILKAVEYYEKDGSGEAFYKIAVLFRSENEIADETFYNEYLDMAVEMGYEPAIIEKILIIVNSEKVNENNKLILNKLKDTLSGIGYFVKGYLIECGILNGTLQEAFDYYYRSAGSSYEPALVRLCVKEKEIDRSLSYEYFLHNWDYGNTIAKYCMGCILFLGIGVLPDKKEGILLLIKAAEQGNRMAAKDLYSIYDTDPEFGNKETALTWLRAAEKQDSVFTVELSNRLLDGVGCDVSETNDQEAFALLVKASESGNITAMNNLGWVLKNGRGCDVDYERARQLFEEAAEQGSASALYHLGEMYENGLGVQKSLETALKYYKQAAEAGNEKAKKKLEELGVEFAETE